MGIFLDALRDTEYMGTHKCIEKQAYISQALTTAYMRMSNSCDTLQDSQMTHYSWPLKLVIAETTARKHHSQSQSE